MYIDLHGLIVLLAVGLVAGWLASFVIKLRGFNLLGYLVVGVLGSFIGGFVFRLLHVMWYGVIGQIVAAFVGSLIVLAIIRGARR